MMERDVGMCHCILQKMIIMPTGQRNNKIDANIMYVKDEMAEKRKGYISFIE